MKKQLCKYLLFVQLILSCLPSVSQEYSFKYFWEREGVNTGFIYDFAQDHNGYLLVATDAGVYRYNGSTFYLEKSTLQYSNGFANTLLSTNNKFFAGFLDGEVAEINPDNTSSLKCKEESKVIKLIRYNNKNYAFYQNGIIIELASKEKFGIQNATSVSNVTPFNDGIVVTTNLGLVYLDKMLEQTFVYSDENLTGLVVLSEGIALANEKEVKILNSDFSVFNEFKHSVGGVSDLILEDNKLYCAGEKGVEIIDLSKGPLRRITKNNGLSFTSVNCLYSDLYGNLWIGTNGSGINCLEKSFYINIGKKSVFKSDKYIESFEFKNNHFIVTENGLYAVDNFPNWHSVKELLSEPISVARFNNINKLYYWSNNGLFELDLNSLNKIKIEIPYRVQGVNSIDILDGEIKLNTIVNGVLTYNVVSKKWSVFNTNNGLNHNHVLSTFKDGPATWIFTNGSGFTKYINGKPVKNANRKYVRTRITDAVKHNEQNYFSSLGYGIICEQGDSLYEPFKGIPDYIYSIEQLDDKLYFITNDALYSLEIQTKKLRKFKIANNLVDAKFKVVSNKEFIISSKTGLNYVYWNFVNPSKISVKIIDFEAQGEDKQITQDVILPYGKYNFKFNFEALKVGYFREVLYSYKLEGLDDEWSEPEATPYVRYKKIKDGEYNFKVKAVVPNSDIEYQETSLKLIVKTPFWKKAWFIVLAFVSFIALVFIINEIRVRRIRENAKKLKKLVDIKTEQLVARNNELEQYTYAVSHDLKNPVINIKGLTEILQEDVSESERKEIVGLLAASTKQLHNNILALIEVLKTGTTASKIREVNLLEVFNGVKSAATLDIKESNASINEDFELIKVNFDKEHLKSIMHNLLSNALKYRSPNRDLVINVATKISGKNFYLSIEDNGLGMDLEKHKEKLFGMFSRIHDHVEGSGIGMHLLNSIVEKYKGKIEIDTELDKGTKFTIILPIIDAV